ncbi:MAG: dUTP diphosphatase [Alphaproteobacteria bacterium]|nr:dUTP diphosphatase [Alphaproteobacteria bacterium]
MELKIKRLNNDAVIPTYGSKESAGIDLYANIKNSITIVSGAINVIPTGMSIEIPNGFFGMVCSRSGLAAKHGLFVLNSPGVIDSDYRGEIMVIMANYSNNNFIVEPKFKIAQLIITKFEKITIKESDVLSDTERGTGGLGSTGLK